MRVCIAEILRALKASSAGGLGQLGGLVELHLQAIERLASHNAANSRLLGQLGTCKGLVLFFYYPCGLIFVAFSALLWIKYLVARDFM